MTKLTAIRQAGALALLGFWATPAMASTVFVTSNADSGPGTFRAAIDQANADPTVDEIKFLSDLGTVLLNSSVTFTGAQALDIDGKGTEIAASTVGAFDLFVSSGGGDLRLRRLGFADGANGIFVSVPATAEGEVSIALREVEVEDNALFGVLIDDLTNASAASISLRVSDSEITGNGLNVADADGLRVDEGGDGDITARVDHSEFEGNGADGLELDEAGAGDVTLIVHHGSFDGNGLYPFDKDDGVDIDEAGDGTVWFRFVQATVNDNTDDGIDMDEDDAGDMHASMVHVETSGNGDKGVNLAENGDGGFLAKINQMTADANDDAGLRMREFDAGDFLAKVKNSAMTNNGEAGIEVKQVAPGSGLLDLKNVTLEGNLVPIDADGVTVTGNSS